MLKKLFSKKKWTKKDKVFAAQIEDITGHYPRRIDLFKQAFQHRSTFPSKGGIPQSNERLEYLGDAVLGMIIAEYLYFKYPTAEEGFLTTMRSKLVKRRSLAELAEAIGLKEILSEFNSGIISTSMVGNAMEALIGALHIECDYKFCYHFIVNKLMREYFDLHSLEDQDDNFKSRLLEYCQKNLLDLQYKVKNKKVKNSRDHFITEVFINKKRLGEGRGFSKKSAEQQAAKAAMKKLHML